MGDTSRLTENQLRALASPARSELLSALEQFGPQSASELAIQLGRKVKGLYYHLQALDAVGLIRVREVRKGTRRDEAVYELAGPVPQVNPLELLPDQREQMADSISALLRYVDREVQRAYGAMDQQPELTEFVQVMRESGNLDEKTLGEVRALLAEALRKVKENHSPGAGRRFGLTVVVSPILPQRP